MRRRKYVSQARSGSSRFLQGDYMVFNHDKYVGKKRPRYRSGWEHAFMRFCDNNPNVIKWASECVQIPYRDPFSGRQRNYVPDFFVLYKTKNNKIRAEIVEIKPKKQSIVESKQRNAEREVVANNHAKWTAAQQWCKQQGLIFRVVTEEDIFKK